MKKNTNRLDLLKFDQAKRHISIVKIPINIGSDNPETKKAPDHLLKSGLVKALEANNCEIKVLKDIKVRETKNTSSLGLVKELVEKTSVVIKKEIIEKRKILALGGDHTVSIGTIAGASEALSGDIGVIWIDIHGDINTHETSPSQNIHGMASSTILGIGDKKLTSLIKTKVKKENILYIGLKDLDFEEVDLFKKYNLNTITIFDILEKGFPLIIKKVEELQERVRNIWISFDIDSVDKTDAPASDMTTFGSLTYREIENLFIFMGQNLNIIGLDIVEVTPKKDIENKTSNLCITLASYAFGKRFDWYTRYMTNCKKNKK